MSTGNQETTYQENTGGWWWTSPRYLWVHFLAALAILLGLATFSHLERQKLINGHLDRGAFVDISGQQRMLSQRILILAEDHHSSGSDEASLELRVAITKFLDNHATLLNALEGVEGGREFYFESTGPKLDAQTRALANLATNVLEAEPRSMEGAKHLLLLRRQSLWQILPDLDKAVKLFGGHEQDFKQRLQTSLGYSFYATVLVILLEGALIFWPAYRSVNQSLGRLEKRTENISEQNQELQSYAQKMAYNAYHDPLTGLTNRKRLLEFLEAEIANPPEGARLCVLHIDLDGFKQLNDRLGHAIGDVALKQAANVMLDRVRGSDLVARTGGDEFVIVAFLTGKDPVSEAEALCLDLIDRISTPFKFNGMEIHMGASIGFALANQKTRSASEIIGHADMALYKAKEAGKGKARQFNYGMQKELAERNSIFSDLERGVDEGEFVPFFQPIQDIEDSKTIGLELVTRWCLPDGRVLPLDKFSKYAEEARLLDQIGARVQLDGFDAFSRFRQSGWTLPRLSINVFAHAMQYSDFADRLHETVLAHGFHSRDVMVEVKESVLLRDAENKVAQTISALRRYGFEIYIDNFGVGFSSLSVLSQLDVNGVKIDRRLVADISNPKTKQVISAITKLGDALALGVIATGIETPSQFETAKHLGVQAIQGRYLAMPMPIDELLDWLRKDGRTPRIVAE